MRFDWDYVLWGAAIFVVSAVVSLVLVVLVIVFLPRDYFLERDDRALWVDQHPLARIGLRVLKNLAGLFLIVAGILLSLPGIPGQGLLTVLVGVILIDFPGKQRFLRKFVCRPKVTATLNRIREKFGKRPLRLPEGVGPARETP